MREPELDPTWPEQIKRVHAEHRPFADPRVHPNVYSWYWQRTHDIVGIITTHLPNGSRILDVGCAQGTLAITLAEKGYRVTANDIRDYYLNYARLRDDTGSVSFVVGNFVEYRPDEPFDAVIFTEVIEHVVEHEPFLKNIWNCLRPGGLLVVTTPNHDYFREKLPSYSEVSLPENKDKEFTADGSDHFYLFTKEELEHLIASSGFELAEHRFFLPFLQHGGLKLHLLWRFLPAQALEWLSRWFDRSRHLCVQQLVIARKV